MRKPTGIVSIAALLLALFWATAVYEDPVADSATPAFVKTVPLAEPTRQIAQLSATASGLPWLGAIGLVFLGFGALLVGAGDDE